MFWDIYKKVITQEQWYGHYWGPPAYNNLQWENLAAISSNIKQLNRAPANNQSDFSIHLVYSNLNV